MSDSPPEGSRHPRTGSVDLDDLLNLDCNLKHQKMSHPEEKREKRVNVKNCRKFILHTKENKIYQREFK